MMDYIKNPMEIETESFRIIDEILDKDHGGYPMADPLGQKILQRVIHTSADFEYVENLYFSEEIISRLKEGFKEPLTIFTDTAMAMSGINKKALHMSQTQIKCYVSDEETAKMAREQNITRSMAAILRAVKEPGKKLFVFGNAPTALYQTMSLYSEIEKDTLGIIGVPVGFVGAAESKAILRDSGIPCIAAIGRKGGSNVAAAIINAILYEVVGRDA